MMILQHFLLFSDGASMITWLFIFNAEAKHPPQKTYFNHLYPRAHPFVHNPSLTGESWNTDKPVN